MNYEISVTFEGDHVLVRTSGEGNYAVIDELFGKISEVCERHQCFKVLGIADSSRPIEAVEGYEVPGVFRKHKIDERYRLAWVELNPEGVDVIDMTANILAERGLPGHLFATEQEAREWLFNNAVAPE